MFFRLPDLLIGPSLSMPMSFVSGCGNTSVGGNLTSMERGSSNIRAEELRDIED
jgi:hypothetical protein